MTAALPPKYPGYILRQSLVDFCQKTQKEIDATRTDLVDLEEVVGDVSLDMIKADAIEMGKQLALRSVCQWAAEHQAPENDFGINLRGG